MVEEKHEGGGEVESAPRYDRVKQDPQLFHLAMTFHYCA